MAFYDYAVPMFLLVFLIICFMAFLWFKQRSDNVQPPVYHKPIVGYTPRPNEGFQSGPGSGSGSGTNLPPTQLDLPAELQLIYGKWEVTPQDKYYDDYEENELNAIAIQAQKFNSISPPNSTPPDFGSTLGSFDSNATRIPWDKDNETYKQSDVVWGYVSEQASRSIFLKTYINEVAGNIDKLGRCSAEDPANFCYKAPLLNVTTTDQDVAKGLQILEAAVQGVGSLPMAYAEINFDLSNFNEVVSNRYASISNSLGIKNPVSHALEEVPTNNTRLGPALSNAVGERKVQDSLKHNADNVAKGIVDKVRATKASVDANQGKILMAAGGATLASWAATAAFGAGTVAAITLTVISTTLDVVFGLIGGLCMVVEAFAVPIATSLYKTGGVCPEGYRPITDLIDGVTLAFLSDFIPIGSFLTLLDPYICWQHWADGGLTTARLRLPPKMPAFLADRSLSLVYHAGWQSGSSAEIPMASNLEIELDPLPPGYQWFSQSDLKDLPNTNEITQFAYKMADLSKTTTSYTGGGGSNMSKIIQVQMCTPDTIPSKDGKQCMQKTTQTTSQIPVIGCPAGKTCPGTSICPADAPVDDGYNCWSGQVDPDCKDPQFQYTTTTTWDDNTGYFRITPSSCSSTSSPNLRYPYSTRITCPPGYQRNGAQDLVCHSSCPAGYTADGALCKGPTKGYTRDYKFGSYTMFKAQQFDVNILKELSDVKVPYCDFSKPSMLNKMAQFYNSNSLLHPTINGDGTIQIQMITRFFGVIASSELSCDVACTIEFITYDPITGGNYSVKVGCTYGDDDPEFQGLSFCYRRFYFIRVGNEPPEEFTVTGCTNTNYNSPDGKSLSYNTGANLLVGLSQADPKNLHPLYKYPMTKRFDVINKENVTIVDWESYDRATKNHTNDIEIGIGLLEAGITVGTSVLGAVGGAKAITAVAKNSAIRRGTTELMESLARADIIAGRTAEEQAARGGALTDLEAIFALQSIQLNALEITTAQALQISRSTMNAIVESRAASEAAAKAGVEGAAAASNAAAERAAINAGVASGLSVGDATRLAQTLTDNMRWPVYEAILSGGLGIAGGVGTGIFISMYLHKALEKAFNVSLPTNYIDTTIGTNVFGDSTTNLFAVTNQNWWKVNHGKIYELAGGFAPALNYCQITSMGDKVPVSSNYCRNKYIVRNMVNMYHNTYQNAHIKEIIEIEPRGTNGCYYKWNEVEYIPATNTEGVVLTEKEMIMTNEIKDITTCTYRPTGFTDDINNSAYKVRSYLDFATASTATPRIIYPTRSLAFTSDLYARYVRVRPPLSGTGGSGTDGFITLGQISVFDCSGFNVSTGKTVFATSAAEGAAEAADVVSGSTTVGDSLATAWQPATTALTEYWELDLSGTLNISELVYFGAIFPEAVGRNKGVRIEFLYTNGPTDIPTYTYTLPTDDATQIVNLYSSSFMKPMFPLGGPIKIPRPVNPGTMLAGARGCTNKCEDRSIIDSLISQYNNLNDGKSSIVKVLRAITPSSSSCEYEAEVLTKDIAGSTPKNSLTKQTLSMEVSPSVSAMAGGIKARYLKVRPSFTPGTVLEFSKILITGISGTSHPYITSGATNTRYNMSYQLEEIASASGNSDNYLKFLTDPTTPIVPTSYPKIFRAGSNNPLTFFLIDLTRNYDIYDITFVGAADRIRGGIIGIQFELYSEQPGVTDYTPFDGVTYDPVYRYTLPTDDIQPPRIIVAPPAKCTFTLAPDGVKVLKKPSFLQETSPPLSATDTSGGVFGFSSVINTLGSAWNAMLPINPTGMAADITSNVQKSDEIVHKMLDTIAANKTLLDTNKKCKDPEVLARIMTAYNIAKAPKDTQEFGVIKNTMTRILKSGQSTANTCDVMFENLEEFYDDYIIDITDKANKKKTVKTARFKFTNVNNVPVPDPSSIVYDISANALGLMTDAAALSPLYSGPFSSVDCRSPAVITAIKEKVSGKKTTTTTTESLTSFYTVEESFQSTPLCCEYKMTKVIRYTDLKTKLKVNTKPIETYVKALYTLGTDGYTKTLASAKEYDPSNVTIDTKGVAKLGGVITTLPSLFFYDFSTDKSTRIITQSQKM